MTWFVAHKDRFKHAINELPKQRDRGAAIIATAILEEHLLLAIQSRIERHEHTEKKMFTNDGPLSSFSTRIDFGVLIGLYDEFVQRRLHLIRKIRNNFAHNMEPTSFKSQVAQCARLNPPIGSHRRFNKLFRSVTEPGGEILPTMTMFRRSTNPRTQFIRGVQQICAQLSLSIGLTDSQGPWEKSKGRAPQPSRDTPRQPAPHLSGT